MGLSTRDQEEGTGLGWPPEPAERDWRRSLQGQTRGSRERVGAGPGSQEASKNMPGNALRLHLKFQLLANLLPQERVSHQWGDSFTEEEQRPAPCKCPHAGLCLGWEPHQERERAECAPAPRKRAAAPIFSLETRRGMTRTKTSSQVKVRCACY